MDRVSSMQSFVKVVENGGFAAAARQLHLSPSLVTTHIKSLEDRLGVRLLDRNTRKVSLTEVGQAYYERCLQILAEIDEADQIAESSQMKPKGVLRLNVAQEMPPVITPAPVEFVTRYPGASVRVTVTSRMVDLIERHLGSYRMAVCGRQAISRAGGAPNIRRIWPLTIVCCSTIHCGERTGTSRMRKVNASCTYRVIWKPTASSPCGLRPCRAAD
jgi:DNA-binding transcriptional LysR family regulator